MTITEIKKNIINRIMDDRKIINNFNAKGYNYEKISDLKDTVIFDYANLLCGKDFISVEVSEFDRVMATETGQKDFSITIDFGLYQIYQNGENKLDELAESLKKIVYELYPEAKKYKNVAGCNERYVTEGFTEYHHLYSERNTIRQISFMI